MSEQDIIKKVPSPHGNSLEFYKKVGEKDGVPEWELIHLTHNVVSPIFKATPLAGTFWDIREEGGKWVALVGNREFAEWVLKKLETEPLVDLTLTPG